MVGYFPRGRKSPTFALPTEGGEPQAIIDEMYEQLAKMDAALTELQVVNGDSKPIGSHPVLGPLTASQWRRFHHCHTRHHMKQVRARIAAGR